jgi:hypothetical protein
MEKEQQKLVVGAVPGSDITGNRVQGPPRTGSNTAAVVALLKRPKGATMADLTAAWLEAALDPRIA